MVCFKIFFPDPAKIETRVAQPKKPKHLKRKLDAALQANDTALLAELDEEKEKLSKFQATSAKNFMKTCRKLIIQNYGEAKWNPDEYDRLISTGLYGKSLLRHLGISHDQINGKQKGNSTTNGNINIRSTTEHKLKNKDKRPIFKDKENGGIAKIEKKDGRHSKHKKCIDQRQEIKHQSKRKKLD